jgi:hypothetical protein
VYGHFRQCRAPSCGFCPLNSSSIV